MRVGRTKTERAVAFCTTRSKKIVIARDQRDALGLGTAENELLGPLRRKTWLNTIEEHYVHL